MFAYTTATFHRRYLPTRLRRLGLLLLLTCATSLRAAVVEVQDEGVGNDYMSGDPVTLPAARLSTNRFGDGVQCIINRPHCVKPAAFDSSGRLDLSLASDEVVRPGTNGFPAYLVGQQYVWFLQDVRHYTNYICRVTVDCPSTFYLLVDNRVNEFGPEKPYGDPVLAPRILSGYPTMAGNASTPVLLRH